MVSLQSQTEDYLRYMFSSDSMLGAVLPSIKTTPHHRRGEQLSYYLEHKNTEYKPKSLPKFRVNQCQDSLRSLGQITISSECSFAK